MTRDRLSSHERDWLLVFVVLIVVLAIAAAIAVTLPGPA